MIDVMEPVFLEDEARDAHRYIAAISRARARFPTVRFVLIDVGYRSPQVKDLLLTPIDFYIRYDPQTFRSEFKGTIEAMANPSAALPLPRPDGELESLKKTIDDLRELVLSRSAQQSALDERIAAIISLQPKHVVNISGGVSTQTNEEKSSRLSPLLPHLR
jgi:hypothetical protein